ncbi:MAG: phage tail sheath C-terminal domain-containing protein [Undibacterium umbellatum]|uniref:phage tail sheath family protein n=1 Tax=Undibacterium umbellatum TaxID=2762300 RepID=UPI003BB6642E
MATYKHPGIYIQEVPGTRSIQGASTSTPVFIGVTEFGPIEQPTLITSWNAYQSAFGNLAWYAMVSWSVYEFFNEGGTACWVVRCADTAAAKSATATLSSLVVNAVTAGTWGNSLGVMISNGSTPLTAGGTTPVFNLSVTVDQSKIGLNGTAAPTQMAMPNALLQRYVLQNNLQVESGQTYYVLESFNGFTGNSVMGDAGAYSPIATKVNSSSMFIRIAPNAKAVTTSSRPTNTNTPSALKGGTSPNYDFNTATALLQKVQGISLLSVPDITTYEKTGDTNPLLTQGTLINQELLFCENSQQRNLFYVIDPPFGLDVQSILSFKTGQGSATSGNPNALSSDFGAIYYPWVYIYNPIAGANVPIPPSGPTLGRYAYTDTNVGVWKSPAGVDDGALLTAVLLDQSISDSDQDQLNPEGINAIRNFINYGNVIWGARTLALNTEWTYISIRRLFIYVEQSLKQSLQWVVFEPNDQTTWSSVTRDVTAFLTTLWQQGGLFGATAQEAFFVTCDASNNPPNTRMLGQMFIDIGLAPVYPAEFVILRMSQKTAAPDSGG